jgi:dynein heavy chain
MLKLICPQRQQQRKTVLYRCHQDKLADGKDIENFEKVQKDIMKKSFDDIPESEVLSKPLIYCHFAK